MREDDDLKSWSFDDFSRLASKNPHPRVGCQILTSFSQNSSLVIENLERGHFHSFRIILEEDVTNFAVSGSSRDKFVSFKWKTNENPEHDWRNFIGSATEFTIFGCRRLLRLTSTWSTRKMRRRIRQEKARKEFKFDEKMTANFRPARNELTVHCKTCCKQCALFTQPFENSVKTADLHGANCGSTWIRSLNAECFQTLYWQCLGAVDQWKEESSGSSLA